MIERVPSRGDDDGQVVVGKAVFAYVCVGIRDLLPEAQAVSHVPTEVLEQ